MITDLATEALRTSSRQLAVLAPQLAELTTTRDQAILSLRSEGWGYDRIAAAAGLSKQRIVQIVKRLDSRTDPLTNHAERCTLTT
jgi:DNA-binding NarL/FixJ family response regulator